MKKDEALEFLRRGTKGIAELNRRLEDGEKLPSLWEAALRGADLRGANLSNVDFGQADLREADLREAQLLGTSFFRTDLSRAKLTGGILSPAKFHQAAVVGTDLSNAGLGLTVFSRSNLKESNFSNSNLSMASFTQVDMSNVRFDEALMGSTVFGQVDLSCTFGLETVRHHEPSTIGIDTLYASSGKIPDAFVRGCGVPDEFIAYKSSFVASAIEYFSCFISYSHCDKQFARQLHDRLQAKGIRCWLDEHEIRPGDDIYRWVDQGVRLWDKVLLCCSEASLNSWWVEREIETAIEKEQELRKEHGKNVLKIIPLNLDGSLFSWDGPHAATIRKRLAADFTDWKDKRKFEKQLEGVVKALRSDYGRKKPIPASKL